MQLKRIVSIFACKKLSENDLADEHIVDTSEGRYFPSAYFVSSLAELRDNVADLAKLPVKYLYGGYSDCAWPLSMVVKPNSVVLTDTFKTAVAVSTVPVDRPVVLGMTCANIICSDVIDAAFLKAYFYLYSKKLTAMAASGYGVSTSDLGNFDMPELHSVDMQRKIGRLFSSGMDVVELERKKLVLLEELVVSSVHEAMRSNMDNCAKGFAALIEGARLRPDTPEPAASCVQQ